MKNLMDFKKNAIISLVGAGGKTSCMFTLAEELRKELKILVTTTTKIYMPKKNKYDFLCLDKSLFSQFYYKKNKGIYVYGDGINKDGKLMGMHQNDLINCHRFFDVTIVEADGSKQKPIKGWNPYEPVVCEKTDTTIGILDISVIGKKIDKNNVHRVNAFAKITDSYLDEDICIGHLVSMVNHPDGLFKNALGEKILFINKVENEKYKKLAMELVELLVKRNKIDKIIIGSIKYKHYYMAFKKN
ncbi:selenium cofactor biosynthesis protein YqeC [Marinisporobacter balticus]|uniref:Putative selenium-dependent hydroxylase accessory protein YqeC n=1 Tax=Marinisporobacter balticus TaxID=2018667 RepID=A0A4R2KUH0_9FIRM|nr:selenium cofactor biosynthesis protein YqeC [Marinisporobacter balticus]TCO74776.1 putative selenium-dependent hydroxylase accessory protein YqeC [Marinisporobacter balticus]